MANIQEYLNKILLARYGKEVRGSIHDAIQAMNTQVEDSETSAGRSAIEAATKASEASAYAEQASTSANNAANSANQSESYATGDTGSAKYYYEQAKTIIESLSGALRPMGTVPFANLPDVTIAVEGDMYNISDEFTTTSDFKEGSGVTVAAGSNVYKTTDGHWDVLAGSPVTGIKGDKESSYRRGNVNITTENIGAVSIGGDIADNIVTFTSDDCGPNGDPALLEIPKLTTGEKLSSIMQKVSRIANNFRYMIKLLGKTDISAIGDGTVTGSLVALNDNLTNNYLQLSGGTMTGTISGSSGGMLTTDGNIYLKTDGFDGWISSYLFNLTSKLGTSQDWYYATNVAATGLCSACVVNNIAYITMEITPTQITHGTNLVSNLPCPHKQIQTTLPGIGGSNYPVIIGTDGRIWVYYPTSTTLERIDCMFSYPL